MTNNKFRGLATQLLSWPNSLFCGSPYEYISNCVELMMEYRSLPALNPKKKKKKKTLTLETLEPKITRNRSIDRFVTYRMLCISDR